jgi:uncharacterized membrane protein YoaK (UPF0700 family)
MTKLDKSRPEVFYYSFIGGLTFLAGAVNICAIALFGFTVSHYTGNVSKAAIALGNGEILEFGRLFSYIALFFLGSAISGFLFHEKTSDPKRRYAVLPVLFGIMIFSAFRMTKSDTALLQIIALVMGVQNGMFLEVRGILIRTTHMTGYLTDAGFSLGMALRGHAEGIWKLRFYFCSILAFFAGGVAATVFISLMGLKAIEVLSVLYLVFGGSVALVLEKSTEEEDLRVYDEADGGAE